MSAFIVGTEACQALFNWTGVEVAYPCGFPANEGSDLIVQYTTGAPAVTTTLVLGIAYSVALDPSTGNATVNPINAGMPAPSGTITITRNTPALEPTQFANLSGINADTLTSLLVSGAMRDAELKRRVGVLEGAQTVLPLPTPYTGARLQRIIRSAADLPIRATDQILNLKLGAPLNIQLPSYATRGGIPLTFKDVGGTLGADNATLIPGVTNAVTDPIDGSTANRVMNSNFEGMTLMPANDGVTTGWSIT